MNPGSASPNRSSQSRSLFRRGEHWIWMTGAALAVCLLMIAGLLGVVVYNGMGFFCPHPLVVPELADGTKLMGAVTRHETFHKPSETNPAQSTLQSRTQFKVANRDVYGFDFRWIEDTLIQATRRPEDAVGLEREEYGDFYGFIKALKE